jgi:DNA polymerase-3 subunit epsilon
VYDKRALAFGAPSSPGVYLFVGKGDQILYVGRARNLRERLRSYFRSDRQRPAVEAALAAVERIEWRVLGSELEAALEELRLIRELRPPGNARVSRPERQVWLRARGDSVVATTSQAQARQVQASNRLLLGPLRSRRTAQLAARALTPKDLARPETALPRLHGRLCELAEARRFEDAARLRDRIAALERVCRELRRLDRVRRLECCILVPAGEGAHVRALFVAGGRIAAERTLPPGGGAALEVEAGLAAASRQVQASNRLLQGDSGELDLYELLLVDSFLRRPPPELRVAPLQRDAILRARSSVPG